jgi:hypothetical protein
MESSGNIEVEGLRGSISGGFHMDKLRFRNEGGKWSTLEEIDFEFNGLWKLVNERRLIVDRFTVARGEIYASSSEEGLADDESGEDQVESEDLDDGGNGMEVTETNVAGWKEVRIDLAEIADLTIIDEDTGIESSLGRLAFKDFHYLDGNVENMGIVEIENLVARDDELELVGLTGSTESGFRIERLAFREAGDDWSHLDQIAFEFNGVTDLIENQRLVINRFSVDGGVIYTDRSWQREAAAGDETSDEPPDDGATVTETEWNQVQIDLVQVANLKFINRVTGVDFQVDEISIAGLQFEDQRVTALGEVTVAADHVEFRSGPSEYFADQPASLIARQFSGVVRAAAHETIASDISFEVDVCFAQEGNLSRTAFFDGRVVRTSNGENQARVTCEDFTFTDYLHWKHGPLPTHVTGELTAVTDPGDSDQVTYTITPGATFHLGELPFQVETEQVVVMTSAELAAPITATHRTDTGEIRCRIFALQDEPYWAIDLTADDPRSRQELYANVLFGQPLDALPDAQTKSLQAALQTAARVSEGD